MSGTMSINGVKMATKTTNFGLSKPLPNDPTDQDVWGTELNTSLDGIDSVLESALNFIPVVKTIDFNVAAPTAQSSTIGDAKNLFLCNATSGVWTASLPDAGTAGNFTVAFKKTDATANAVTILAASGDSIDGASSWPLSAQNDFVVISSDAVSSWSVIARSPPAVSAQTIADKTLLGNISGSTTTPSALTITQFLDSAIGSTQGSVLYRGASAWAALSPGTSGYFLKTQGAAANPTWTDITTTIPAAGALGSLAWCSSDNNITFGQSVAGSTLYPAGTANRQAYYLVSGGVSATALSGTWRCLGNLSSSFNDPFMTLFQRIA